jgi:adenylate cyclase
VHFRRFTIEDNNLAKQLAKEVIDLDPQDPNGYVILGWAHYIDGAFRWSKFPKESLARSEELARKVLELDDSRPQPYMLLAKIYRRRGQWDEAMAANEHAFSLVPDSKTSYHLANTLLFSGRPEEAIALFKKALRLDPIPFAWVIWDLGLAYFHAGQYEDALTEFNRLLDRSKKGEFNPEFAHRNLAAIYVMLGREKEAQKHAVEVIRINPKFTLKGYAKTQSYKNQADKDRWIDALRKAGLPD